MNSVTRTTSHAAAGVSTQSRPSHTSQTSHTAQPSPDESHAGMDRPVPHYDCAILSAHRSGASRARSHSGKIVGGVLGSTVLCGLLLSFRNNSRTIYVTMAYIHAAARRFCGNLHLQLARRPDATSRIVPIASSLSPLPQRGRELLPASGHNMPQVEASGERAADQYAGYPTAILVVNGRGEASTGGVAAIPTSTAHRSANTDDPYHWDRELAALRAEVAELRWYSGLAPADPPPAYV